jgi:hypothetical protein
MAVLVALGSGFIWRLIAERLERRVELQLHDSEATPRDARVKAGVITMVLNNAGQEPCRLHIRSAEIELISPGVPPGRRREWTVRLDPGVYLLSSSEADQTQESKQGLLQVVPALGAGETA